MCSENPVDTGKPGAASPLVKKESLNKLYINKIENFNLKIIKNVSLVIEVCIRGEHCSKSRRMFNKETNKS